MLLMPGNGWRRAPGRYQQDRTPRHEISCLERRNGSANDAREVRSDGRLLADIARAWPRACRLSTIEAANQTRCITRGGKTHLPGCTGSGRCGLGAGSGRWRGPSRQASTWIRCSGSVLQNYPSQTPLRQPLVISRRGGAGAPAARPDCPATASSLPDHSDMAANCRRFL